MSATESQVKKLQHVVVIPDGDRRWAKAKGLPPWEGHRRGADNVQNMLAACKERNIPYLSMWGFSTENWDRNPEEVSQMMDMFRSFLKTKSKMILDNKIRVRHLGRKDRLPQDLLEGIHELEQKTAHFTEWNYQVLLDYGGQDEIVRATKKVVAAVQAGELSANEITTDSFYDYLDTAGIPNPDFIIRTSGEQRLSGILPYQAVYAELLFVPENFPDFTKERMLQVLDEYEQRTRRFGAG